MKAIINKINQKADQMDQETFNVWCSIILAGVVILPLFIVGFHRWAELYLR